MNGLLRSLRLLIFTLIMNGGLCAGMHPAGYPPEVDQVLTKAGENRGELENVLVYFEQRHDTLALSAAQYLIANLEGHRYTIYGLYDTSQSEVDFDVLAYPDYKTLIQAWDEIEAERGELDFEKKDSVKDINVITADYLIENITWAIRAWREKPWCRSLSFEDFCAYVLPYRGSGEPLESWRQAFWRRYRDLEQEMENPEDAIEAARLINSDIKTWFTFDSRFYRHPTDQGFSEMLTNRMGRCEDMTNLTIYAMRANGLAVTSDYTPHWANAGNNHAWNAIVTPDGRAIPFMGAEANPGEYRLAHRAAKVYRKTFAQQKGNLAFQKEEHQKVPPWLRSKSYKDVTADYTDVRDVTVTFDDPIPDSIHYAYLCVFNSGEWKAIHWGKIDDQRALFTDMGKDIAYLPMFYINEELVPAVAPLILEKDGRMTELAGKEGQKTTVSLMATSRPTSKDTTEAPPETYLTSGQEYELFYWDDDWISVGKATATDQPLELDNVPEGFLYWLVATDLRKEERIFTVEKGVQVWW